MSESADWRAELRETVARIGHYLYGCQVVSSDLRYPVAEGELVKLEYAFLRRSPGPYCLQVRREGDALFVREGQSPWFGPVRPGTFFRVMPGSGVREPSGGDGGVTFCYSRGGEVTLVAYDRGGIWDDLPNMEAFRYQPQVAGTYYADAYSAFLFAWLARSGYGNHYREAASLALDFVARVYPQYLPMVMDGLTHSDFKNPAYLETVEELMAGRADPERLARWRGLYRRMVADEAYSPTNVYALRYHWLSARSRYLADAGEDERRAREALQVVLRDQTPDGLIHDNNLSELSFGGYADAHDLTYHLYTLACLARGYDHLPLPEAWDALVRGVLFSLALTTPGGEVSYVGRGANNVYHLAAAVYAFLRVAHAVPDLAPRLYRAVRLIFRYLRGFQLPSGAFPTALNAYPEERMGWNHCHTPYNALSAYFLARALEYLPSRPREEPLVLEGDGTVLFPEARYAAASNHHLYLALFGGNDLSYPYSGVHRTGVAGIAALGMQGRASLLPVLEQSLREGEWSTSDLPDVVRDGTVSVPAGTGTVRLCEGGVGLSIAYGGFLVDREYCLEDGSVLVRSRVTCLRPGRCRLVGVPGLSLRTDEGYGFAVEGDCLRCWGPEGHLSLTLLDSTLARGHWEVMEPSSTPRGWHRKVALVVEDEFREGQVHSWTERLSLAG